jgi:hypothetical protein
MKGAPATSSWRVLELIPIDFGQNLLIGRCYPALVQRKRVLSYSSITLLDRRTQCSGQVITRITPLKALCKVLQAAF